MSVYKAHTEAEVALAAAGAWKDVLGVSANANFGVLLNEVWIDFDGVASGDKPVTVAIARCTFATNPPGTSSTTSTVKQSQGRHAATGFAAGHDWTAAPTVIEAVHEEEWSLDPNKGLYRYPYPLGEEPESALGEGWLLRVRIETGDVATGAVRRAGMRFRRA